MNGWKNIMKKRDDFALSIDMFSKINKSFDSRDRKKWNEMRSRLFLITDAIHDFANDEGKIREYCAELHKIIAQIAYLEK